VDDSHSSSGSESVDVECIDIFSSSSSSEHLATKESDHSSSSSSDNESDEEESLPGAWKVRSLTNEDSDISSTSSSIVDSDSDEDVDNNKESFSIENEELDRTTKMLQHLNKDKLQKVQQFIKSLDSTNMAELSKKVRNYEKEKTSPPMDLSQQSITPSEVLSLGLNYVGFDYRRQASASEDLNIRRFISFYGAPPQALAPLFKDIREMFQKERPACRDLLITCNWLKGYDLMHVLEGRWGYCEDYLRPIIKRCQGMMQALRRRKMKFVKSKALVIGNIDTVRPTMSFFIISLYSSEYSLLRLPSFFALQVSLNSPFFALKFFIMVSIYPLNLRRWY